jgi:hypothetical protein
MSIAVKATPDQLSGNRRYVPRRTLRLDAVLSDSGAEIVIHDISATGLLIETSQELSSGETLVIDLPEHGAKAATVAWSSGRFFGCQFELSIPVAAVSAALLRSPVLDVRPDAACTPMNSAEVYSEKEAEPLPEDDRASLRTRGLVLVGLTGLSWAFVGWTTSMIV